MSECLQDVTVVVEPPPEIVVEVQEVQTLPVVEVQVPGIQGASSIDKPLDVDPLETYLSARGGI